MSLVIAHSIEARITFSTFTLSSARSGLAFLAFTDEHTPSVKTNTKDRAAATAAGSLTESMDASHSSGVSGGRDTERFPQQGLLRGFCQEIRLCPVLFFARAAK